MNKTRQPARRSKYESFTGRCDDEQIENCNRNQCRSIRSECCDLVYASTGPRVRRRRPPVWHAMRNSCYRRGGECGIRSRSRGPLRRNARSCAPRPGIRKVVHRECHPLRCCRSFYERHRDNRLGRQCCICAIKATRAGQCNVDRREQRFIASPRGLLRVEVTPDVW